MILYICDDSLYFLSLFSAREIPPATHANDARKAKIEQLKFKQPSTITWWNTPQWIYLIVFETTIAKRLNQALLILEEFALQRKSLFYFTKIVRLQFGFDLWFASNTITAKQDYNLQIANKT